jgi:hypothetical protein
MYYEEEERDPFEAFGEVKAGDEAQALDDADEALESDADEDHDFAEPDASIKVRTGFSWVGFLGGLSALMWVAGAVGGVLSYFGANALATLDLPLQAGLVALTLGPALLFWITASAAGEALKARRLAVALTEMAREARGPFDAGESHAQRLSHTVKAEIESLNEAIAGALDRLAELQAAAHDNAALFGDAVAASRENTAAMADALSHERHALADINNDLRGQTDTIAHSIGRQVRLMREASKLVKHEITDAEDALENHLAAFTATATVMGERTAAFHQAADEAAAATSSMNGAMAGMLDSLSEATRMTDTARKSSEQAVMAANDTAGALRDTTRHAVHEAKRVAEFIRGETGAMQKAANDVLATLRDAAAAARDASAESQSAADRHSAKIEQRLSALASTANAGRKAAPAPRVIERHAERQLEPAVAEANVEVTSLRAAAGAAMARGNTQPRLARSTPRAAAKSAFSGFSPFSAFLPRSRDIETPKAANEDFDLVDFDRAPRNSDATLKSDAIDLVSDAGVDLGAVLRPADLERIAQSSRNGASARRRAVLDAAPTAVGRIARLVRRDDKAQSIASDFRARPELAKSEQKGEASNLVRAYLLIDAALA